MKVSMTTATDHMISIGNRGALFVVTVKGESIYLDRPEIELLKQILLTVTGSGAGPEWKGDTK